MNGFLGFFPLNSPFWADPFCLLGWWERSCLLTVWFSGDVFEWTWNFFHWNLEAYSSVVFELFWSLWNFCPYNVSPPFFLNIKIYHLQNLSCTIWLSRQWHNMTQKKARGFLCKMICVWKPLISLWVTVLFTGDEVPLGFELMDSLLEKKDMTDSEANLDHWLWAPWGSPRIPTEFSLNSQIDYLVIYFFEDVDRL